MFRLPVVAAAAIVLATALPAQPAAAQVPAPAPAPEAAPRTPRPPRPPSVHRVERRQKAAFEEVAQETFTVGRVTEIDISNMSGDIVIAPGGGRDGLIEVTKRGYGDTREEAARQLAQTKVSLNVTGGRGEIRTHYVPQDRHARERQFRSSVDFRVTVPAETRLKVKTMSGNIHATKLKGDLSFEAMSGNIIVEAGGRLSLAKTMSGDVEIRGVSVDDPLVASSMSGVVRLERVKARYLDLSSISGDIVATQVTCDRAQMQTVSGDVEFSGPVARGGRYELKAHSGDIRLAISGDAGFDVEANTFSGNIRSELPIRNLAAGEDDNVVDAGGTRIRLPKRASFRGTYKNGGATIELTSFSGNIVLTK